MEILLLVGIGVGLASVAGIRAFLPLALVGAFALAGLFEIPPDLGFMADTVVVAALFTLAVVEGVLDKVSSLRRVVGFVMLPVRVAAGAVLFAAATGAGLDAASAPELAAGAAISGFVAVLGIVFRPVSGGSGVSPAFLSAMEDIVGVVGGAIAVFVAFLPLALVAFLLFFFYRVRKRRGRKYEGLRILGD